MKISTLTAMIALIGAVSAACRESDGRAPKAAPTDAAIASSASDGDHANAIRSRLRPSYRAGWGGMYPATLPPADRRTVAAVRGKIESVLPANWTAHASGNIITVARDGDVPSYNCVALDIKPPGGGDDLRQMEEWVREYDYKAKYEIKLLLTRRISKREYARLESSNEPCLRRYSERPPSKTMFEDFLAENPDCGHKELPVLAGYGASVFETTSEAMGACPAPRAVADECRDVWWRLAKLFEPYEDTY